MTQGKAAARGTLYVVSAPSGAGKTSLVTALLKSTSHVQVSISHTTRSMRPGETNGVEYHFVSEAQFKQQIDDQAFLEWAKVFDHYYGTSRAWVEGQLAQGEDVILEIDWQGYQQIMKVVPEAVGIYILPPSKAVLEARLRGRGQDPDAVIQKRMAAASDELAHFSEYPYLVINEDFDEALEGFRAILLARRHQRAQVEATSREVLAALV